MLAIREFTRLTAIIHSSLTRQSFKRSNEKTIAVTFDRFCLRFNKARDIVLAIQQYVIIPPSNCTECSYNGLDMIDRSVSFSQH